ncbi:unnamed protein product [Boreogadus saida]
MEKTRAGGGPLIMGDTRAGPLTRAGGGPLIMEDTRALGPHQGWALTRACGPHQGWWRAPHHGEHQGLGASPGLGPHQGLGASPGLGPHQGFGALIMGDTRAGPLTRARAPHHGEHQGWAPHHGFGALIMEDTRAWGPHQGWPLTRAGPLTGAGPSPCNPPATSSRSPEMRDGDNSAPVCGYVDVSLIPPPNHALLIHDQLPRQSAEVQGDTPKPVGAVEVRGLARGDFDISDALEDGRDDRTPATFVTDRGKPALPLSHICHKPQCICTCM